MSDNATSQETQPCHCQGCDPYGWNQTECTLSDEEAQKVCGL